MSKESFHVQCKLSRPLNDGSTTYRTSYIPEKYAVAGKYIAVDENPELCYRWFIEETYNRLPSSEVNDRSQDYKRTRKASDV
jgi:hypothetical protein